MSRSDVHRYLVAYDIGDDPRRSRLAHVLAAHGERIQFSVFILDAGAPLHARLVTAIESVIDPTSDAVAVCDLGPSVPGQPHPGITHLGRREPLTINRPFVI
ncbi:MAG: CRISPR-associated endonuclease Cas2 [Candidatus Nanopelagicales bacterium]|nr:CRISPR-associated endonuclease Cas2 [Candidatus Nanopelagicales bacterium]